ncbi:MAG: zinc-dependent metalloprotease [Vulcanimicrobiaceae bacterium]
MKIGTVVLSLALVVASAGAVSAAAPSAVRPSKSPAPAATTVRKSTIVPYDTFIEGETVQHGLFTIWRQGSNVALELRPDQLDKDYVELGVPINGIGEGLFSGMTDLQNCRIIRFTRQNDKVAILFPSTRFLAKPGSPEQRAVEANSAPTVVGVSKILAEDVRNGDIIIDAAPFLDDITNIADFLTDLNGGRTQNPTGAYRLDPDETYFGKTKSFPNNVVIVANQTFSTQNPQFMDVVPDGRSVQIQLQYNIAEIPPDDSYMPRIYDDRVGYFVNAHADFSNDSSPNKELNYIVRWNMQPSDPSQHLSPALKPILYYLSDTIPQRYREPIRAAVLTWNKAFERIGISNAVEVKDQPDDPNFDPDDIRYNVIRWITEKEAGFAEAQLLYNPYSGEMIKSGVVIDSDLIRNGKFEYPVYVGPQYGEDEEDPSRASISERKNQTREFIEGERAQYAFGITALSIMNDTSAYDVPAQFANEYLESIVLHESGHDFGLRHNFMGSTDYTSAELQSKSFTSRYGVSTSVMEYSPINIWPKGTPRGNYFQTVLGPYDYYAIHWGYAPVPGAKSPQAELTTLHRWASRWSDPRYKYASDEDVSWVTGRGIDPRNQQYDLSRDNIGWCETQMKMTHDLIAKVDQRFPRPQQSYDDLRYAFGTLAYHYGQCAQIVSRYLGGEYVSRSLRGDPHAQPPLDEIPLATQRRAYRVLERYLYSSDAWDFSPTLLRQLVTQYRFDDWEGNIAPRHDVAVEQIASTYQLSPLARLFAPVTLQRLDDMHFKYPRGTTMELPDLFTWMQATVYGDIGKGHASIALVRRGLQRNYLALLSRLTNAPAPGTPADAQALAHYELGSLHEQLRGALAHSGYDIMTRAHLEQLDSEAERALKAQAVIPAASSR